MLSKILSRLPIKGAVKVSSGATHEDHIPVLDATGKIDASMIPSSIVTTVTIPASSVTFTPVNNLAAVNVQAALEEVTNEFLVKANNLSDVVASTGFNNLRQAATTTYAGVVELATSADVEAGTDTANESNVNGTVPKVVVTPSAGAAVYLKKSGGAMTGNITLPTSQPASPGGDYYAVHKKYVDDAIAAQIVVASNTPFHKTIWVSKGGTATDTRVVGDTYYVNKPFATLSAAKGAATSGDTICVLPGTYAEKNLLKNGVNWYFFPGAIIDHTTNVAGAIWDDSATHGANAAITCRIMGYGQFKNSSPFNNPTSTIYISNASSDILIECDRVENVSSGSPAVNLVNGKLDLYARTDITAAANPIDVTAGTHIVRTRKLIGAQGIFVNGGTLTVIAESLDVSLHGIRFLGAGTVDADIRTINTTTTGSTFSAISMDAGTLTIRSKEIKTAGDYCVYLVGSCSAKIIDATIKNTKNSTSARAVFIDDDIGSPSAVTLILKDTDLDVHSGATFSIGTDPVAVNAQTVKLHGYNRANKAKSSTITFTGGMFEVS